MFMSLLLENITVRNWLCVLCWFHKMGVTELLHSIYMVTVETGNKKNYEYYEIC